MLLSQANLNVLSKRLHPDNIETSKLERISLFIDDQRTHQSGYKSPNHHSNHSEVVLPLQEEASDSLFSASVSQIHHPRPKRPRKKQAQLPSQSPPQKENPTLLPQNNAHGFHLLQKFVSPNLEINRITLRPKGRPKLGLFNKGKSSAKATKPLPDLVFSEAKFLKPDSDNNDQISRTNSSKAQLSISRFFRKQKKSPPSPSSTHQQQKKSAVVPPKNPSAQVSHRHLINPGAMAPDPFTKRSLIEISSSHSNETIERVLKECKEAPQVISYHKYDQPSFNSHHAPQQQLPTYARVKTPVSDSQRSILIESHESKDSYYYLERKQSSEFSEDDSLLMFYKDHNDMFAKYENKEIHDGIVDWQIESVVSFDSQPHADSIPEADNVMNFWLRQYKRGL